MQDGCGNAHANCQLCGKEGALTTEEYWIHLDRWTEVQHPFVA